MFGELNVNEIYNCSYETIIEQIGDSSIDLVLTDIPYGISKKTRLKEINEFTKQDGKSNWDGMGFRCDDLDFDIDDYLFHCCRILKPSSSIIVWSAWQQLKFVDDLIKKHLGAEKGEPRIGIWRKTNPSVFNMNIMALQPYEFFVWNRKGSNIVFNNLNGKYMDSQEVRQHPEVHFYPYSSPSNRTLDGKHPNSKPVAIFQWLIETYTNEFNNDNQKSVVFDGCMGGGTTAIAAMKANRNFIGFEIDKEYYEIANRRIINLKKQRKSIK